jgi:iron complex outermembrane receptor protein
MMNHVLARALLCASTAAGLSLTAPAFAQTTPDSAQSPGTQSDEPPPQASDGGIQDIIVTARRRAESLQSTPVTVTAFSGDELTQKGITNFDRLAQATPGVNFDANPRAAPRPFFRGIGSSNQGAGGDPSSVAFLDGVYLARGAMLGIDFYDMERVEVLKGPQGTLWGKNVVGGAVNFITNKPGKDLEASAELTYGEYTQLNGNLMVNVPVRDTISTRLVLGAVTNDGYRHTVSGRALDNENKLSARGQIKFDFGANSDLLLSADVADQDLGDNSRFNVLVLPFHTTAPYGYDDYKKPRVTNSDIPGFIKSRTGGARAELTTDALGFASWTTTAGWRTLDYSFLNDLDGTDAATNARNGLPTNGIELLGVEKADSYSVESRLSSLGNGPFTWVAGLYYNHDDIYRERETEQQLVATTINRFFGRSRNDSYAAFGEAQYKLGFGLRLFAGGRYTKEEKLYDAWRLTGPRAAPVTNYNTGTQPGRFSKGVFTYRLGADMRFSDNVFAFATVSTGFKSGAFQEQPSNAVLARVPTAPEKVTNYEIGLKTDWLDRRVRLNVSAFYMDYTDFQTIKVVPDASAGPLGQRVTIDTADATIKGVESELIVRPVEWFDAAVRYTYLHPYFTRYIQTSAFDASGNPLFTNGAGNRLSRTPVNAVVADVGVQTPEADWGWLRAAVTMDYQSDIYDNNINSYTEYRRARTLWDASLTYHINEKFSTRLWVKNLSDVEYRIWQTNGGSYQFVQYGPPRQFGVTLDAKF